MNIVYDDNNKNNKEGNKKKKIIAISASVVIIAGLIAGITINGLVNGKEVKTVTAENSKNAKPIIKNQTNATAENISETVKNTDTSGMTRREALNIVFTVLSEKKNLNASELSNYLVALNRIAYPPSNTKNELSASGKNADPDSGNSPQDDLNDIRNNMDKEERLRSTNVDQFYNYLAFRDNFEGPNKTKNPQITEFAKFFKDSYNNVKPADLIYEYSTNDGIILNELGLLQYIEYSLENFIMRDGDYSTAENLLDHLDDLNEEDVSKFIYMDDINNRPCISAMCFVVQENIGKDFVKSLKAISTVKTSAYKYSDGTVSSYIVACQSNKGLIQLVFDKNDTLIDVID